MNSCTRLCQADTIIAKVINTIEFTQEDITHYIEQ